MDLEAAIVNETDQGTAESLYAHLANILWSSLPENGLENATEAVLANGWHTLIESSDSDEGLSGTYSHPSVFGEGHGTYVVSSPRYSPISPSFPTSETNEEIEPYQLDDEETAMDNQIESVQEPDAVTYRVDHIPYDVWVPIFATFILIDNGGPAKLLSVCKYWQNVLKSTPALWMSFSFDPTALLKFKNTLSIVRPQTLINIDISLPSCMVHKVDVEAVTLEPDTLFACITQIKSLKLKHSLSAHMLLLWKDDLENLSSMSIGCLTLADVILLDRTIRTLNAKIHSASGHQLPLDMANRIIEVPKLRRLHLHDIAKPNILPLPWHQITSLVLVNIRDQQPGNFIDFLRTFTQLQYLKAAFTFRDPYVGNRPICFISLALKELVSLEVNFGEHTHRFLDQVTLPKLEHLDVTFPRSDVEFWLDRFGLLAQRSKFPLKTVIMKNSPVIMCDPMDKAIHVPRVVLSEAPSLERVEIYNSCPVTYPLVKALESPKLGPNLRYLKVVCCWSMIGEGYEQRGEGMLRDESGEEDRLVKRMRQVTMYREGRGHDGDSEEDEDENEDTREDDEEKAVDVEPTKEEKDAAERKRKFGEAIRVAQRNNLARALVGMLRERSSDHNPGHIISPSPNHPTLLHAVVVRAHSPSMAVRSSEGFEDFWVREGEEVQERECHRIHVFF